MYADNGMNVGAFHQFVNMDKSRSYLLVNYRSYGRSEGTPSEQAIVSDSLEALAWAEEALGGKPTLILIGYSIGSGIAMQVASRHQPDSLILICPFDDKLSNDQLHKVLRRIDIAPSLRCPVSIFAGTQDGVILPERTKSLISGFKQVKPEVYWFEANHNSILSDKGFRTQLHQALNKPLPCPK